jgi:hypothetical protein
MQTIGIAVAVLVGVLFFINGLFMLVSPMAWFRLPWWLGAHGTMTERKYATPSGMFQVRIAGVTFLGIVIWVVCNMMFSG